MPNEAKPLDFEWLPTLRKTHVKNPDERREPEHTDPPYPASREGFWDMLVERGMRVLNVAVVGDAYSIASNFLRKSGALPDTLVTDDRLLEMIVTMFHRGESNKIKLANKAISQFQSIARH